MTTEQIKQTDAHCLNSFLLTISPSDRRFFITKVVETCGQGIKKKTFYNWKAGCCRIPDFCKKIIEEIAGCTVFPEEMYSKES